VATHPLAAISHRARGALREKGVRGAIGGIGRNAGFLGGYLLRRPNPGGFRFAGTEHAYFVRLYNTTWRNERCVELPLAIDFLARQGHGSGLEVGNVLSHYVPIDHQVVDKYEQSPGVSNVDVVDIDPTPRFSFIVAVSTLEHVGWEETPQEPEKVERAISVLRQSLAGEGRLFVTCPMGLNPHLDDLIRSSSLEVEREGFMQRARGSRRWSEITKSEVPDEPWFDFGGVAGHTLWIAEFAAAR
jgi:hypothetical protein